jgi:4-hydroxythreonine-4-phosphate dehydrogenase
MTSDPRPLLAITMGDPAGVGPEVVVSALARRGARAACRALVVGDSRALGRAAERLGRRFATRRVTSASEAESHPQRVCLLDLGNADPEAIPRGQVSAAAGRAAAEYITRAVALARAGEVAGIVTAPINKEALRLAGVPYPGHTEMLAALCETPEVAMMLVHGEMRVSHVTTHAAVREACDLVTRARVLSVIRLTDDALGRMGLPRRRIAVSGLNPHAGESGLFGDEEGEEIAPAVAEARREGIDATGPLPPDSVFARHRAGEFDAVVAMTHDQGHIAVKTVGFAARPGGGLRSAGVNVTLGLPTIRTSVDHGTAFDIAGKGLADSSSMVEAIQLAGEMARRREG